MRRVLGLWWFMAGALLIAGGLQRGYDASPSLAAMPDPWPALVGLTLFVGGLLCLAGTFRLPMLSTAWALMRVGAVLCMAGWLCYGIAVLVLRPAASISWLAGFAQAGVACAWWLSVTREARTVRRLFEGEAQ